MRCSMRISALLLFFVLPSIVSSEPQIHQFFPDRPLLLGQPLFWTVEIRYPMWESYDLKLAPCSDLKMSIAEKTLRDVAGEIRVVYRIVVVPIALKTSCTPSLMISDEKGQTTVLNGKRLLVHRISGDSEDIKNPTLPAIVQQSSTYYYVLFTLLAILIGFCMVLASKRIYGNMPSQRFLRAVRKAAQEVQKDKLPIQVWRLLRSNIVWGFEAETFTPAQLQQKALQNPQLQEIAITLQSLEAWRYSGSPQWDKNLVMGALNHAEELVESKSPFRRWRTE